MPRIQHLEGLNRHSGGLNQRSSLINNPASRQYISSQCHHNAHSTLHLESPCQTLWTINKPEAPVKLLESLADNHAPSWIFHLSKALQSTIRRS